MTLTTRNEASSSRTKQHTYAADACRTCWENAGIEHQAEGGVWHIPSRDFTQNYTTYTVNLNGPAATCDCPHGRNIGHGIECHCNHVKRARFQAAKQDGSSYELFDGDDLEPDFATNLTAQTVASYDAERKARMVAGTPLRNERPWTDEEVAAAKAEAASAYKPGDWVWFITRSRSGDSLHKGQIVRPHKYEPEFLFVACGGQEWMVERSSITGPATP